MQLSLKPQTVSLRNFFLAIACWKFADLEKRVAIRFASYALSCHVRHKSALMSQLVNYPVLRISPRQRGPMLRFVMPSHVIDLEGADTPHLEEGASPLVFGS